MVHPCLGHFRMLSPSSVMQFLVGTSLQLLSRSSQIWLAVDSIIHKSLHVGTYQAQLVPCMYGKALLSLTLLICSSGLLLMNSRTKDLEYMPGHMPCPWHP